MYEKTLVHKAAIDWEQKYKELKDKYDKLACKIIVSKLKNSGYNCNTDSTTIEFSIVMFTEGMVIDRFIENCIVPQLKKKLKTLHIWDE